MSLDERLRAATIPDAAFDVEGDISDVRRRAGRIRRRRTGAAACALTLLVAAAVIVWPRSSDDATIDTADSADAWFLPASVPDGYQLAWVDPPSARPNETGGADPWVGTYAYGYQSPTVEFDTRIIVGADLDDPAATAAVLDDGGSADEVNGRGAVRWRSDGATVRLLVELDGAVAHVIVHPRGASFPDPPPLPPDQVVDGYAASITRIDEAAWRAALESGADVADRYGPLDGKVVVEGDGWQSSTPMERSWAMDRSPRSTRPTRTTRPCSPARATLRSKRQRSPTGSPATPPETGCPTSTDPDRNHSQRSSARSATPTSTSPSTHPNKTSPPPWSQPPRSAVTRRSASTGSW